MAVHHLSAVHQAENARFQACVAPAYEKRDARSALEGLAIRRLPETTMARRWNAGPSDPRGSPLEGAARGVSLIEKTSPKRRRLSRRPVKSTRTRPPRVGWPGLCNLSCTQRRMYRAATLRTSPMLIAASILAAVAVVAVVVLFIREAIEKRGYLKNARRKPGRIPLN
jgi:hypothetical protein